MAFVNNKIDYDYYFYDRHNPKLWKSIDKYVKERDRLRKVVSKQYDEKQGNIQDLGSLEDEIYKNEDEGPLTPEQRLAKATENTFSNIDKPAERVDKNLQYAIDLIKEKTNEYKYPGRPGPVQLEMDTDTVGFIGTTPVYVEADNKGAFFLGEEGPKLQLNKRIIALLLVKNVDELKELSKKPNVQDRITGMDVIDTVEFLRNIKAMYVDPVEPVGLDKTSKKGYLLYLYYRFKDMKRKYDLDERIRLKDNKKKTGKEKLEEMGHGDDKGKEKEDSDRNKIRTLLGLGLKYFNDPAELVDRLEVLIGSKRAGNSSVALKNEIAEIVDHLKQLKLVTDGEYKQLYSKYVMK